MFFIGFVVIILTDWNHVSGNFQENMDHKNFNCTEENSSLWLWLESLQNLKSPSLCSEEFDSEEVDFNQSVKVITGPLVCNETSDVKITHKKNNKIMIERTKGEIPVKSSRKQCFELLPAIKKISGAKMENGVLNGKGSVIFQDETKMKMNFYQSIIHGQVLLFDKHEELQVPKSKQSSKYQIFENVKGVDFKNSQIIQSKLNSFGLNHLP